MKKDTPDIKMDARSLIESQHIMTIATSSDGYPWSAPVYYIFKKPSFYFFSKPSSRHITDTLKINHAAVSIYRNSTGWKDIQGIQMEGQIHMAGMNKESTVVFNAYLKKFNYINQIFKSSSPVKDVISMESAFKVRMFKFVPDHIYYLDNSIKFGFREKTDL